MLQKRSILFILILVLFSLQAGLSFLYLNKFEVVDSILIKSPEKNNYYQLSTDFFPAEFYNEAYAQADSDFVYENKVYAGILPHHLFVKGKIANFFNGLQKQNIKTVVLIGPNHFEAGADNILLSKAQWQTPYGNLLPDEKLINALVKEGAWGINDQVFAGEHSISGLVPFVKKSLPQAKIVPIILKYRTNQQEIKDLSLAIEKYSHDNTLVLASVDFSHYQSALVADFHDAKSRNVIENLAVDRTANLEIDSPASIAVVLSYAKNKQAEQANLLWQTNSSLLLGQPDLPGTSHQFFYFTKGDKINNKFVDFLFFGDMMLDRNVGAKIAKNGLDPLLVSLAGEENRFFMGSDLISANLEGAVTKSGQHYAPVAQNDFAFSTSTVAGLKKYNFNFFNIANNHLTDQGAKGVEETRVNLADLDFDFSGCADAQVGECSAKALEINGVKVSMIGLSMVYHNFDLEQAKKIIVEQKKNNDLVIINIHWGVEYDHKYNTTQSITAHALLDSGADVIIGHHPHVVQGLEIYNNKPIFYSLGNFIFDQYFSTDTQTGLAVGLSIDQTAKKKTIYFYPIKGKNSVVSLMSGLEKDNFLQSLKQWSNLDPTYQNMLLGGKIEL